MQRSYLDRETFEIIYRSENTGMCANVIQYEEQNIADAIVEPNELLIKQETISIKFDYPLKNEVSFEYSNEGGFTRIDIFRCIYEGYKKIYETEKKEVGDPGIYPGLYNRKPSKGRYGIWGHYMNELIIERIVYDSKKKSIELSVGS